MNNVRFMKLVFGAFIFMIFAVSCEKQIYPKLESAPPVLVVDAWINNKIHDQVILLTLTQPYFEETAQPPATGADVVIENQNGDLFNFIEDSKYAGYYVWKPTNKIGIGKINDTFKLTIKYKGQTFESSAELKRVPPIDSITFKKRDRTPLGGSKETVYVGQFWAKDPQGTGDAYWIRTFKNDTLFSTPSEINTAVDAGFSEGAEIDGIIFLPPIRSSINPSGNPDNPLKPFKLGDSVRVQIHSISIEAKNFLNLLQIQTNKPGGFAELFATPLANLPTNIRSLDVPKNKVVGFFNVAAISELSVITKE